MKKLFLISALLLAFSGFGFGQAMINIIGNVSNVSTGSNLSNYQVELIVYDSLTATTLYNALAWTDSAGNYFHSISTVNFPPNCWGEVSVLDCQGIYAGLHFPVPTVNMTFSGFDFSICPITGNCNAAFSAAATPGSTVVNFIDYSSSIQDPILQWAWDFGDGGVSSLQNPTHTYGSVGNYFVHLSITTNSGCTSSFSDTVVVGGSTPTCAVTLSYGVLASGAMGYTATVTGSSQPTYFLFDFNDGNTLLTPHNNVPYSYPNGGIFNPCVQVVLTNNCSATGCTTVNAGNGPTCQADFYAVPDTTGQYSLLLIDNSMGNNLQYSWDFGDGGTSTQTYPQHTYAGPGTYYVCLIVVDSPLTCTSSFCDSITVINKINTPFTINVMPAGSVGLANAITMPTAWSLFPNPANNALHLRLNLATTTDVACTLLDLQGRTVQTHPSKRLGAGIHNDSIDLTALADGIYLAKMTIGGSVQTRRFVVAH